MSWQESKERVLPEIETERSRATTTAEEATWQDKARRLYMWEAEKERRRCAHFIRQFRRCMKNAGNPGRRVAPYAKKGILANLIGVGTHWEIYRDHKRHTFVLIIDFWGDSWSLKANREESLAAYLFSNQPLNRTPDEHIIEEHMYYDTASIAELVQDMLTAKLLDNKVSLPSD